ETAQQENVLALQAWKPEFSWRRELNLHSCHLTCRPTSPTQQSPTLEVCLVTDLGGVSSGHKFSTHCMWQVA
ncbi:hypothetical protein LEMLEM_LOCUS9119, partial [Lemmus lemmus]